MKRILIVLAVLVAACGKDSVEDLGPAATPKKVIVGSQEWNTQNLDVDQFANGDDLLEAQTNEAWSAASKKQQPAWCYYDQDPENGRLYGKLYNWYAVADPRGVCPSGWHVSSDMDWAQLEASVGGTKMAGKKLKSVKLWEENAYAVGTDDYGWSGVPGGVRADWGGFDVLGRTGAWWTTTDYPNQPNNVAALNRYIYFNYDSIAKFNLEKGIGMSIRCVKD